MQGEKELAIMGYKVAVAGATGNVGREMLDILAERRFPISEVAPLASSRSIGTEVSFGDKTLKCRHLDTYDFSDTDICLMSAGGEIAREWAPRIGAQGCVVIDNSSAWRMDPDVPLVVPEVNADELKSIPKGIVANPNCVAIPLTVVLKPLHDLAGVKRVVVATYQSSSGKGATGLADLDAQVGAIGRGEPVPAAKAHAARLAGNVLPHDWKPDADGYTEEEVKVIQETRKILGSDIPVSPTCVRVPVRVSHALAVNVEFDRPVSVEAALAALEKAPGVVLHRDRPPLPLDVTGRDEVFVGRVRIDRTVPHGLNLWVVAANLRKGAATNAVQVAQALLARGRFG
jgi:aspartate-semialdehyde dehydrogenase